MKRHLRDRTAAVRLPRRLHEASTRLPSARAELTARLGREPTESEVATQLGVSPEDLARIESTARAADEERAAEPGADTLGASDDRVLLAGAFQALDETERRILYLRFVKELTGREAAEDLGISEAALERRTETALARLRNELEGRPPDAPEPKQRKRAAQHSGRLLLRMPQSLHAELAEAAEREDVSLNQYITNTLAASVAWHGPAEHEAGASGRTEPPRWLPAALVTNIVVVLIAGVIALVLLVLALQRGL